jgi:hypothetical protein
VDWLLSGEDAALFTIDADGKLSFKAAPDFEDPKDKGQDNTYIVNINAEDLSGNQSSQPVVIAIGNVDENPPSVPSDPVAPVLVINPEGNGLFFDPGSETSDALDQWVEINLAMTPGLTGDDWVGVKVIAADGSLRDLGGVGHVHADDNQMRFSKPLLVQLKPNESLQLTRLNPPEIGGETTETVEFSSLDADNFRAVVGGELALNIKTSDREPSAWEEKTVAIQTDTADGIFDFRQPDGSTPLALQVKILGDCADINQVGVVRLDTDATTGDILGSVNGVLSTAGADFRAAVKAKMEGFDGVLPSIGGGVYEQTLNWTLDAAEQDAYALVMISQSGEVYTFGASTAADGKQHIKELGQNLFGFEDRAAGQGSDWDFNDVVVEIRTA